MTVPTALFFCFFLDPYVESAANRQDKCVKIVIIPITK